ncbi:C2 domain-containing protein [Blastomyces dermatitidis ER-3]|uniref:C2 domain-containing protein n=1 Tax=Ajellomyces dermatitidis (strain ER-3 / ATCC MYA-2586) TaxID=559297 RepID=A0ABP2EXA6_AJEDR|nr:C2 domain-containing protein [Blastomyces dermatitidis ER-3]EEQ88753.1 C2 domain-containing protein [Blastomyces dermatitidis ER-3]
MPHRPSSSSSLPNLNSKVKSNSSSAPRQEQPAGGFDSTPVPAAPPGFTLKFTFHRASNLPIADISTLSADPFVLAYLTSTLPRRNKQDPDLVFRTPTVSRSVEPVWNCDWIVANVPASGFELKCRIYDEDPVNSDDKLGNVKISVPSINESWPGITEQPYKVQKRTASKRAYFMRSLGVVFLRNKHMNATLYMSVQCLGRTPGDEGGRMYTIGPLHWSKHFSPLIGRLAGTMDSAPVQDGKKPVTRYNFQAIQIQLKGPVPASLYHRYVEFKPFVKGMFTARSLRGRILNHALHQQHVRIYNFDRSTVYGVYPTPSHEFTQKFLEFVHYDMDGRIFTYVITLDGQWRFTETGTEFGINMLSKHTMHSNVSIYIAFAGEFFVRRRSQPAGKPRSRSPPPRSKSDSIRQIDVSPGDSEASAPASTDPAVYELVIDNDSGTYRPNAKLLPELKEFLSMNLPGLEVTTFDCQEDAKLLDKLKEGQRHRKTRSGRQMTYLQRVISLSSISSSDEEDLDEYFWHSSGAASAPATPLKRLRRMAKPKAQLINWAERAGEKRGETANH